MWIFSLKILICFALKCSSLGIYELEVIYLGDDNKYLGVKFHLIIMITVIENILTARVVPEPWHYDQLCQFTKDYPYVSLGWYALWVVSARLYEAGQLHESEYRRIEHQMIARTSIKPYPAMLVPDSWRARTVEANDYQNFEQSSYMESNICVGGDLIDVFLTKESPWEGPKLVDNYMSDRSYGELINDDLSEQSVQFDNQIISETLAEVYISQGYVDRAIEIYYELSLKFPEKSVYFAGLIDELNENQ